ncbi:hypothetical protein WMY93_003884 [Mugilogobius chulae]|uniref:Uncharacterized protein n=1 Tax=Mugilogobius chulae TaxID=88201 RepID=A0AAW0PZJ3_9GOBI
MDNDKNGFVLIGRWNQSKDARGTQPRKEVRQVLTVPSKFVGNTSLIHPTPAPGSPLTQHESGRSRDLQPKQWDLGVARGMAICRRKRERVQLHCAELLRNVGTD